MDEEATDCSLVINWTIDNFSFWNGDVHGEVLTTERFTCCRECGFRIDIYPRGLGGRGEHLVVRISDIEPSPNLGEGESDVDLSIFSSDGSLLYTMNAAMRSTTTTGALELPPGPKFRDVVAQIGKIETHQDRITVRLRFKGDDKGDGMFLYHVHSVVDVFETSLQISFPPKDITLLDERYIIEYPLHDGTMEVISLNICTDALTLAERPKLLLFSLEPLAFKNAFAVRISMSVLKGDGSAPGTEENDHLFREDEEWTFFSDKLTGEEVRRNGLSAILGIKLIPHNGFKCVSGRASLLRKEVNITPIEATSHPVDEFHPLSPGPPKISYRESEAVETERLINEETYYNQPETLLQELSKELMCLYQDQEFSDFELKCGDVSFPVHRNILSARSPVFKTMLSDTTSDSVDVHDLDPSTLSRFLAFLYTGAVGDLKCDSSALYHAADKYRVPSLKRECADFLSANVSVSNVCEVLSLADKHRDEKLTAVVHDFVLGNYRDVLKSAEWKVFMKREPLLAVETITLLAEQREK